jgi:hypothetical protein
MNQENSKVEFNDELICSKVTTASNKNIKTPCHKNLVYTSAGDNANLNKWMNGSRYFDLWVTYYGNYEGRYSEFADYYNIRKGGKFPNLYYAYQVWPHIFNQYEAILVMDDDILIRAAQINRLFKIRKKYDLWVLQPAFDRKGKISHRITRVNRYASLRYTNFVEVACPLFRQDKLQRFMKIYDPVLVGWGVDWWFLDVIRNDMKDKIAIIDCVTGINPLDSAKEGQREIDRLQTPNQRLETWEKIKRKHCIQNEEKGQVEYAFVPRPLPFILARKILNLGQSLKRSFLEFLNS